MANGEVNIFENGLCDAPYRIYSADRVPENSTAVLTLNGAPLEETRRQLQSKSGVGASYLFTANEGDVLKVTIDGSQDLEGANIKLFVKFYSVAETAEEET